VRLAHDPREAEVDEDDLLRPDVENEAREIEVAEDERRDPLVQVRERVARLDGPRGDGRLVDDAPAQARLLLEGAPRT
jgi:hypothetical protein